MPRVGDPDASCILRVTYELGYLASIIAGRLLDVNLNIHRYGYSSTCRELTGIVMGVGWPWMALAKLPVRCNGPK